MQSSKYSRADLRNMAQALLAARDRHDVRYLLFVSAMAAVTPLSTVQVKNLVTQIANMAD